MCFCYYASLTTIDRHNLKLTHFIDVEKVKIGFPEMLEESDEDELDVSGIVRVQSFERLQNLSSHDKEDKRSVQSSTSSSGRRGQAVGAAVQTIAASKVKVSSVTSSSSQKRGEGQELEQDRERERERERDTLSSPTARRDKAVSFEQTSALPASKPLTAQGQGQQSSDRNLESGRADFGKSLP